MDELFTKLLGYLNSPVAILLCIAVLYQTKVITTKDVIIKEKDNYIKELAKQTYEGINALDKLTTLLESLINRGGK